MNKESVHWTENMAPQSPCCPLPRTITQSTRGGGEGSRVPNRQRQETKRGNIFKTITKNTGMKKDRDIFNKKMESKEQVVSHHTLH